MNEECFSVRPFTTNFGKTVIKNGKNEFWTGDRWSSNEKEAQLFRSDQDTGLAIADIYRLYYKNSIRKFIAPAIVDLDIDEEIDMVELKNALIYATIFAIDTDRFGMGPADDSIAIAGIHWEMTFETCQTNPKRFIAPVSIELMGTEVSIQRLIKWIKKAVIYELDKTVFGSEILDNIVKGYIDWDKTLKRTKT